MKSFNEFIREQEELKEFNLRDVGDFAKRGMKKVAPALVSASLAATGGGVLGVVGPHIRDTTTAVHKAIGDPVGGAGVSTARADAANKVGLFGSDVPAGRRALNGAVGGVGLLGAVTGLRAIVDAGVKRRRKLLNELGDTEQGRLALKSYKRKARERKSIADTAAPVFLKRLSDPSAIESPTDNLKKYYKYSRISTNKGRGIARVNKILGLKDE